MLSSVGDHGNISLRPTVTGRTRKRPHPPSLSQSYTSTLMLLKEKTTRKITFKIQAGVQRALGRNGCWRLSLLLMEKDISKILSMPLWGSVGVGLHGNYWIDLLFLHIITDWHFVWHYSLKHGDMKMSLMLHSLRHCWEIVTFMSLNQPILSLSFYLDRLI